MVGGVTRALATDHRTRDDRVKGLVLVVAMVAVMWLEEIVDELLGGDLDRYGIVPRTDQGIAGIAAAPFLHAGFGHLISNTVPFLLLGATIALGGLARVLAVTVIVALTSGVGTWLVASSGSDHIGASGVVFGFATYLMARGVYNRSVLEIAVGVLVVVLFGASLLGGLAPHQGISWQGHLFGAIGGIVAARVLARKPRRNEPAGLERFGGV